MFVSVIVPTYNGAKKILNALRSLETQDVMPLEVIVLIDGSTDDTAAIIDKAQLRIPGLRVIKQPNSGRARVRNNAAGYATGDLLVFLDDDMVAPKGWLDAHIEHHKKVRGSLLTGKLESLTEDGAGEFAVFEKWQNEKWNENITLTKEVTLLHSPYLTANNFSVEKELFFALGQFDSRLTDAEDYDLAVRATRAGYKIYFSTRAFAYHHDLGLKDFKNHIKRLRQYREAHEKLVQYKPELYGNKELNERFPSGPTGIKKLLFRFFASQFWIRLIEKGRLRRLPRNLRCKVYDIIITANGVFFADRVSL